MRERLQALAERDVQRWPPMPGRLIHVLAPERGIDLEVAAGVADRATGEPLVPGSRFRIASVTKPFVGAAALRLVEAGRVDLDASLDVLLAGETAAILLGGGYDTAAITLRHLMAHTSGILKLSFPPHIVPIQLKNLMPVGTAISIVAPEKNGTSTAPVVNM